MPLYEFRCSGCKTVFETLIRSASTTAECPECGSVEVSRLFSTFSSKSASSGKSGPTRVASSSGKGHGPSCSCC